MVEGPTRGFPGGGHPFAVDDDSSFGPRRAAEERPQLLVELLQARDLEGLQGQGGEPKPVGPTALAVPDRGEKAGVNEAAEERLAVLATQLLELASGGLPMPADVAEEGDGLGGEGGPAAIAQEAAQHLERRHRRRQRSETDLDRVLGHRDPAGGEAGRDQGQLLTDGGGVDAEGSGQVGDRDPTARGPEAGGEADQVDLEARTRSAASTIQRRLAAIGQVHQLAGHVPPPTADWEVRQVIQGIRRSLGTAPAQKEAVLTPTLRRLVASCDPKTRVGARDRALLLLGFGAALRRSELVALDTDDVTVTDEGLRIRIRRSKTDPEAHGDEVGVVKGQHPDIDPVRALQNWLHLGGITAGPLFRPVTRADTVRRGRLSGQTVALIVQRTAQRAGLPAPEAFAGHSLRSGCATQAAVEGAPERAIMRQGRWRSSAPVRRYIRTGDLWQENASAWLGL